MGLVAQDVAQLLGQGPSTVVRLLGVPEEVLPTTLAGGVPAVVFIYQRGVSLYWLDNQVVQVVYQRAYRGAVLGAFMGASQQRVEQHLGAGLPAEETNESIYELFNEHQQAMIALLRFERGVLVQATVQLSE